MNQTPKVNELQLAIDRLEKTSQAILKTNGYTQDVEKIKILTELIKEQGYNESTHPTDR